MLEVKVTQKREGGCRLFKGQLLFEELRKITAGGVIESD